MSPTLTLGERSAKGCKTRSDLLGRNAFVAAIAVTVPTTQPAISVHTLVIQQILLSKQQQRSENSASNNSGRRRIRLHPVTDLTAPPCVCPDDTRRTPPSKRARSLETSVGCGQLTVDDRICIQPTTASFSSVGRWQLGDHSLA